ncbi:hypothetical protein [Cyclobacterium lianum]|uniref:hypothetical protein n=1 Tax=Cyclobacterium lianum TaxID=388280 RepID=UPI000934E37B|nr:hypothetical protein [Cyclobacterium lianum]
MKIISKLLFSLFFDLIWMSLAFMWLMPFGTFDYLHIDFYLCIVLAVFMAVSIRKYLKKYQKGYMEKIK